MLDGTVLIAVIKTQQLILLKLFYIIFSLECDYYDSTWSFNVALHRSICVCCYLFFLHKTLKVSSPHEL